MQEDQQQNSVQPRRPYAVPRLVVYGDVLSLTLGPSLGSQESGSGGAYDRSGSKIFDPGSLGGTPGPRMP